MKIRKKWITAYLLAFCLLLSCFLFTPAPVYADSQKEYSSVLADLQKDTTFKIEDYPVSAEDYSLQVIQIAESTDNELFVYVYQPSAVFGSLVASSINVALGDTNFTNYTLTLCNSHETLYKYLIDDLAVSAEQVREYEITSIYRPFNAAIDTNANNGNTITEVNYPVAKKWIFTTTETGTSIYCHDIETIEITDKYVGFVRYVGGKNWLNVEVYQDSHFIAFSTDKQIDKLVEADVYYQIQSKRVHHAPLDVGLGFQSYYSFGDVVDGYSSVKHSDKVKYDSGKWNEYHYSWNRIQTIQEFISGEDRLNIFECALFSQETHSYLSDESLILLQDKQWVLRFLETNYKEVGASISGNPEDVYSTIVGNVSILRLQFETDGMLYNLGAIDNKQTGSDEPINNWTTTLSLNPYIVAAFGIIFLLFLLVLCPWLFKVIWWVISAPFKGIAWLVNTIKGDNKKKHKKKNTRKKGRRK